MCKRCLLITRKKSTSILKHFSQKIMFKRRGYKEVKCEENKQEFEKKPCYKNQVFLLYCDQDADFVEKSLLTCICMIVNEKRWGAPLHWHWSLSHICVAASVCRRGTGGPGTRSRTSSATPSGRASGCWPSSRTASSPTPGASSSSHSPWRSGSYSRSQD